MLHHTQIYVYVSYFVLHIQTLQYVLVSSSNHQEKPGFSCLEKGVAFNWIYLILLL